jgi:Major Facilitator Superfamily.
MSANALQAPSINALVSLSSSVNLKGFSILRVGNNIGWGFGPAIGGFVISAVGYRYLFLFALICLITSLLISLGISRNYGSKVGAGLSYSRNKAVLILSFVVFLVMMVQAQETVTLTNYAVSIRNIAVSDLGFIYLTNGLFVILLQAPIYVLTRRIGVFRSYWIGTFLYVFGFLSYGFDTSFLGLIISTMVLTIGEDFSFPVGYSIISDISKPENIGRNMGLYNAFMTFGRALGPSIGGLSFSITRNPLLLWLYTTLSGFVGLIIFIFAFKGRKSSIGKSI